ncbi:MAG: ribonuclease P protein component [Burkholderiaceae bacterium]|nr:ribonuclease P protein component [Burkholderiaceae bacterium]
MNFKFPSELRLLKTDDFSSVFNFRKRISGAILVINYRNNTLQHARLGLVVSKKVAKLSVDRNYMRRVLKELFRRNKASFSHLDLVIRPQKPFNHKNFNEIVQEFDMLIPKLKISRRLD